MRARQPKAAPPRRVPSSDQNGSLFLFIGLVFLNAFLVSPFVGWYDTGEMIGTTACLGISHPSGQVLYHLLGKLFLAIPAGTAAWRLGMMSVVLSALASCLFFTLACRLAREVFPGTKGELSPRLKVWLLLLTLAWSLSLPWWQFSVMPLVYGLHLFLGFLLLWVLGLEGAKKWYLSFFILGLAMVFRPTQAFAMPFVTAAFFLQGRRPTVRRVLTVVAFFALGWSTALYLPLRSALHPVIAAAEVVHPLAFLKHVLALRFSSYVGHSPVPASSILSQMAGRIWADLTPLGVLLLVGGAVLAARKRAALPTFLWVALGWGLLEGLLALKVPFPVFEPHQMILGWTFAGLWGALALAGLEDILQGSRHRSIPFWVTVALALWVLAQFSFLPHLLDRRQQRGAQDYARNMLELMKPGAVYFPAEENEFFPLAGYQQAFGFRKDVELLEPGTDRDRTGQSIRRGLEEGRPVYMTRKWSLPAPWGYSAVGPLMEVVSTGAAPRVKARRATGSVAAWEGVALEGVDLRPGTVEQGGILRLGFRWFRPGPGPAVKTPTLVVLLVDDRGDYWVHKGVIWMHDVHDIASDFFSSMKLSQVHEETRTLFVPSDFPVGRYHLVVGLQKGTGPKVATLEPLDQEYYSRGDYQDLDKFTSRGENGAWVHVAGSSLTRQELWPLQKGRKLGGDFADLGMLEIGPPGAGR